jgi:hypothetical protein
MQYFNIGNDNFVNAARIILVLKPWTRSLRATVKGADEAGLLVDATRSRTIRSVILMDDGHVVLSTLQPGTVQRRLPISRGSSQ